MGMPPIVFTSQEVTVYSPKDTAIDRKKTTDKAWSNYTNCENLDIAALKMHADDKPVEYVIRALSPAENDVIGCLVYGGDDDTGQSDKQRSTLQSIELMLHSVRFGLREIKGLSGWNEGAARARVNGSAVEGWTEETIAAIDSETRIFLGRAILTMSRVDQKKTDDLVDGAPIPLEPGRKRQRRKARAATV